MFQKLHFHVSKLYRSKQSFDAYKKDFEVFKQKSCDHRFKLDWEDRYPCLRDNTQDTGFDGHYIYHTAWAARILAQTKPKKHIDIGSQLHFCAIASAFVPIEFYDLRPAKLTLANLKSKTGNLLDLPFKDEVVKSLSCMHTIEHVGLGRYGDTLDPEGDLKAIAELKRVLAKNGNLLFVVPVGGQAKIMFNAHRIYTYKQVVSYFPKFKLQNFSLVPDNYKAGFISPAKPSEARKQRYGCGCFWFKKI